MSHKLDSYPQDYDADVAAPPQSPTHHSNHDDFNILTQRSSHDDLIRPSQSLEKNGHIRNDSGGNTSRKRHSLSVRLEQTGVEGTYTLTADDPEIRELLRSGLAREQGDEGSKGKKRIRDLVFTRQFTTFDRQNPLSSESPFHGFFTLFWLSMFIMFIQVLAKNWRLYGSVVGTNELLRMMFSRDVVVLGLTDLAMLLSTGTGLLLQKLVARGVIKWNTSGWIVQNVWQVVFLAINIYWTYHRQWPWTHTIFMVLHTLVYLMKQHSYAFYNGHLSGVYRRMKLLQRKLEQLGQPAAGESTAVAEGLSTGVSAKADDTASMSPRPAMNDRTLTDLTEEVSDVARVHRAMESGKPLDKKQVEAFRRVLVAEIRSLEVELKGKMGSGNNTYPKNLNLYNFIDWTCLPTLVYELEYPRLDHINWWYVAEKTLATFGIISVMMVISQAFIYPPVAQAVRMKDQGMTLAQRAEELPWLISDMLFPLLLEQLLSWYVIWECILNVLAELTRFADRGFYGPFWNSTSWDMYARDWNRPVHNFLLRHVYHSSISTFQLSKASATFVTFLLSALVHELVMACLFQKVRGYLFTMQLMQLPLVTFSRSKLMRGRHLLGNVVFWTGLFIGPSLLMACYLLI